jgi:hypothetical protein
MNELSVALRPPVKLVCPSTASMKFITGVFLFSEDSRHGGRRFVVAPVPAMPPRRVCHGRCCRCVAQRSTSRTPSPSSWTCTSCCRTWTASLPRAYVRCRGTASLPRCRGAHAWRRVTLCCPCHGACVGGRAAVQRAGGRRGEGWRPQDNQVPRGVCGGVGGCEPRRARARRYDVAQCRRVDGVYRLRVAGVVVVVVVVVWQRAQS